jgi:probable rRNA maturation factor
LQAQLPSAASYELSLRLTDDAEIQELNLQYRQQDKPTDVLAFAALEADVPHAEELRSLLPLYLGDIVISVDTASKQAQQQAHSLTTELAWLAAHGLLHLLGWDHPDEESLLEMLEQQTLLLRVVGFDINFA